ncbi:MAG: hypothetical protein ABR988_13545 [Terriglobales bacterium]|jgi:hypothetical protein
MAVDSGFLKKLQIFLVAALVIAGGRAAYIVYERRAAMKQDAKPKPETALKADYYVTPKKLHAYDLKSARQLTEQAVWVKIGYQLTYYPYDRERHRTDFRHEAGLLPPLQKLAIQDVVTDVSPLAPGIKQVMACFELGGKSYAAPIGSVKGGDFKIYSDDIFFVEDPHDLYKHWPADVWKGIDAHEVTAGMSELQASFAIGMGVSDGSGDYGSRTLHYPNGGKPLAITFESDKAVAIKAGS